MPLISPNSAYFTPSVQRENSQPALVQEELPTIPVALFVVPPEATGGPQRVERVVRGIRYGNGQCTALAQAYGLDIHVGRAINWLHADRLGYRVDSTPEEGAAFITDESSAGGYRTGHVGIVIGVADGWVYVREQNYVARTVTEGWIPTSSVLAFVHRG